MPVIECKELTKSYGIVCRGVDYAGRVLVGMQRFNLAIDGRESCRVSIMKHIYRLPSLIPAILIAVLLVGCGQSSTGGTPPPVPTATGGSITLSVDATSYHPGDTITVTLSNQGPQTIYFQDHLTNCTVIQLQTQVNGNWQMINKCPLLSPTGWHSLDAGQSLIVKLVSSTDKQLPTGVL